MILRNCIVAAQSVVHCQRLLVTLVVRIQVLKFVQTYDAIDCKENSRTNWTEQITSLSVPDACNAVHIGNVRNVQSKQHDNPQNSGPLLDFCVITNIRTDVQKESDPTLEWTDIDVTVYFWRNQLFINCWSPLEPLFDAVNQVPETIRFFRRLFKLSPREDLLLN